MDESQPRLHVRAARRTAIRSELHREPIRVRRLTTRIRGLAKVALAARRVMGAGLRSTVDS